MQLNVNTYIPKDSCVHTLDASVKIVLLAVYSVALFLVETWAGLACLTLMFVACLWASKISLHSLIKIAIPVYVLAVLTIVFNAFAFDSVSGVQALSLAPQVYFGVPGVLGSTDPIPLIGTFCFTLAGCMRGCFYALRIVLLVFASLIVSFTSTSTELTCALASFLLPLRRFGVPVDDIAMVFSLTLRFIPVTAKEFVRVRASQASRGAAFDCGTLVEKLRAQVSVFIPLFVGLFRRADVLARAMDARCYGAPDVTRTSLVDTTFTKKSAIVLVFGFAVCIVLAYFF